MEGWAGHYLREQGCHAAVGSVVHTLKGTGQRREKFKNGYYITVFVDTPNCEVEATGAPIGAAGE